MEYVNCNCSHKIEQVLNELKGLIKKSNPEPVSETAAKDKLNCKQAIAFLSEHGYPVSKSSLYKLTSGKKIPYSKFGKHNLFDVQELLEWCKARTTSPTQQQNQSLQALIKHSQQKIQKNGK